MYGGSSLHCNGTSFRLGSVFGSVGYSYGTNRTPCVLFLFPLLEAYLCTS